MTDSAPKQLPPYGLRIPPDLKDAVQKAAKANNRSMHAEIISRLEESFKMYEGIRIPDVHMTEAQDAELRELAEQMAAKILAEVEKSLKSK